MTTALSEKLYKELIEQCKARQTNIDITHYSTRYLIDNKYIDIIKGYYKSYDVFVTISYTEGRGTIDGTCSIYVNDGVKMCSTAHAYNAYNNSASVEEIVNDIIVVITSH